jgi:thiamine-monophosphate kinase
MREIEIIDGIKRMVGAGPVGLKVGIGDDCAVIDRGGKEYVLWAADMLVEGTHFTLGKDPFRKIGHKAVAVNVSDIAAMGGLPEYITVSIGLPSRLKHRDITAIYGGMLEICRRYGMTIAGGDTNRSDRLVLDVSIMGHVEKERLILRSGAKEGDRVLVTGPVRDGKKKHLDIVPRLEEARFLSGEYSVSSMIDVSDGIAMDMGRICRESGTGCLLREDLIPLSRGLALEDALHYGESFELLFTLPPEEAGRLTAVAARGKESCRYYGIGEVTRARDGMRLIGKDGRERKLEMKGYDHLL